MIMKRILVLATVVLLLALGAGTALAQSGYDLYQKALVKERAEGNVEEAIRLYQRVVREHAGNRSLAAKAQLRMGTLYERMGRKAEAQQAFLTVVNHYADQTESVQLARVKLPPTIANGNEIARGKNRALASAYSRWAANMVVRQVWAGPTTDPLGGVSADGKYLSHVDWETGDLAVRELATEKKRRLTNKGTWFESTEFALFSIISPDSKQVAYAWFNKDLTWDLRVVGLDGSAARVIYRNDDVDYVQPHAWSPDGKKILTSFARRDRTNQVGWVSAADGSAQILKTLGQREVTKMSLSPDGRYIAYDILTQQDPPTRDISLLTADGKREIPLVKHPANDLYPVWTPDGRSVLFASDRTGTLGAWIIQVADGKPLGQPELVKPDMGRMFPIGFTRNGSFFYGLEASSNDIYTAEVDFATGKLLSQPTTATQRFVGSNSRAVWSADGKYLAYTSQRGPIAGDFGKVLVIRSLDTGKERELLVDMRNFNPAGWSPDGRFVLVTGRDKNNLQGIHKIDAQTGEAATLVPSEPGADIQWPAWPSDFKQIYYLRRDPSDRKITRLITRDLKSGREKEIYRAVVPVFISGISLSPDGKLLSLRWNDDSKKGTAIVIMPSEGGELRELLRIPETENLPGNTPILFTPDARCLLYTKGGIKPEDQKFDLWRVPIEGGPPKKTELSMNNLRFLRLHPDGRRLAFTAGQYKAEVWVMENFLPTTPTRKTSASRR
jgi:Tol biopolymer transport system component